VGQRDNGVALWTAGTARAGVSSNLVSLDDRGVAGIALLSVVVAPVILIFAMLNDRYLVGLAAGLIFVLAVVASGYALSEFECAWSWTSTRDCSEDREAFEVVEVGLGLAWAGFAVALVWSLLHPPAGPTAPK
jgi:hypothetical protein